VQFASFADGSATGNAKHGQYLFWSQFLGLHIPHIAGFAGWKLLNIAHCFNTMTLQQA
jgi:hypothetical protein